MSHRALLIALLLAGAVGTYTPGAILTSSSASVPEPTVTLAVSGDPAASPAHTVGIPDVAGRGSNAVVSDSTMDFAPGTTDTIPPTLVSADGAANRNHVTLTFSENVDEGVNDLGNYLVHPAGDPSSMLTVTGAARSSHVVTLTLGSNLAGSTSYTVEVSNLEDLAGNPIAPNSAAGFTTGIGDIIPPTLANARGTVGHNTVSVDFSETVGTGADVAANYRVYPSGDPGSLLTVVGTTVSGVDVILTLDANLDGPLTYTVEVSNVADVVGNLIAPNSTVSFSTQALDVTPPRLVSAAGAVGEVLVSVYFSETVVDGANVTSNYTVFPASDPSSPVPVVGASLRALYPSGWYVRLTLGSELAGSTTYTVEVSNLADVAGNVIAPGSSTSFTTQPADTTPPVLLSASGDADAKAIRLDFSESISKASVNTSDFAVYRSADPGSHYNLSAASVSSAKITLALYSALSRSTAYTVEVTGVEDLAGNPVAANSSAGFTTGPGDTTAPVLVGVSGRGDFNQVQLQFSEDMGDGVTVPSNYSVYPTADPGSPLTVSSVIYPSYYSADHAALVVSPTLAPLTQYRVTVSNVEDLVGNVIAAKSSLTFTTDIGDTIPPGLSSVTGSTGTSLVTVQFNEPVVGADTASKYQVYPTAEPAALIPLDRVIREHGDAKYTLVLGTVLQGGTSYTVSVSNVEDNAGNMITPNTIASFTTHAGGGFANDDAGAAVAVHVQAHDAGGLACGAMSPDLSFLDFAHSWPLRSGADVYLVVICADPVGVSEVSLGVKYGNTPGVRADGQGCDVLGYASCADLEYPNGISSDPSTDFPAAGGGNRFVWDRDTHCQRTVMETLNRVQALVCAFYVYAYSPDDFAVDMNRNPTTGPEFQIVDCGGPWTSNLRWPEQAGIVGFGPGHNGIETDCHWLSPTVRTTWGRLKNMYH